jgi:4-amino-4-deoxy-L-arabinose transferase-like glycosyltransferase
MVSAATSDDFGPAHRFNGARLTRRYASLQASLFAAVCVLFAPLLLQKLTIAEPDTAITLLSFAAFLVWWNGIAAGGVSILRWIVCGLLLAALVMAKGPQPAGFFALGTATYLMVERRWRTCEAGSCA